jgi:hypothetical protein
MKYELGVRTSLLDRSIIIKELVKEFEGVEK